MHVQWSSVTVGVITKVFLSYPNVEGRGPKSRLDLELNPVVVLRDDAFFPDLNSVHAHSESASANTCIGWVGAK